MFKESYCAKYKKNKCEHDTKMISEFLQDDQYDIKTFQVDEGKTEDGYEFITHRFYIKEKIK